MEGESRENTVTEGHSEIRVRSSLGFIKVNTVRMEVLDAKSKQRFPYSNLSNLSCFTEQCDVLGMGCQP